jgi:hypothetical protein
MLVRHITGPQLTVVEVYLLLIAACPAVTFMRSRGRPNYPSTTRAPLHLNHNHDHVVSGAMVSVCGTCQGLQKHLKPLEVHHETENDTLLWVSTSLPSLRTSGASCRACALLLNGVLLHHERLAGIKEEDIHIKAESFPSKPGQTFQDHLSVEVRWKQQDREMHDDEGQDDQHDHSGYPDLKLEFFTDGGKQSTSFYTRDRTRRCVQGSLVQQ